MNPDRSIHVRSHPLRGWQGFDTWMLECDVCDDSMEFATWNDAQAGASHHAERHKRETCGTCGQTPWIRYSEWP